MAARSLGLTYAQTAHVIVPQAIPPSSTALKTSSDCKDTAIITVIGLTEAIAQAGFYRRLFSYRAVVAAALVILPSLPPASRIMTKAELRERAQLV